MTEYRIPYGKTHLAFEVPDAFRAEWLAPAPIPPAPDPIQAVNDALDHPVGGVRLADWMPARSVAIAINDKTRPAPLARLLPPLLRRLAALGVPDDAITLMVAAGTHTPMDPSEFPDVLPVDILSRYRVICHDCDDRASLVALGTTARGTRVEIHRLFAQADLRIVLGNLEPHQFVGFSGGVKPAAIGLAGRETITRNHAWMLDPHSDIARYDDNPARQDIEEIGAMLGVHFALNSVIDENKEIVHVLAGEPCAVMQQGIPRVLALYRVEVAEPFDLMIVSPGGHPKDINLYQAQKGLAHATLITKPGGAVILAAACPEGTGSKKYEEWMAGMHSHAEVIERFRREEFRLGPHKAFQISRDAFRVRVLVISGMPPDLVQRLLLTPSASLPAALSSALGTLAPGARVGIMPIANATIPALKGKP